MLKTSARSGQVPAASRDTPYAARNPANSSASVTMKSHIISFCQDIPNGRLPPSQRASVAGAEVVMSWSPRLQQYEEAEPDHAQQVPERDAAAEHPTERAHLLAA